MAAVLAVAGFVIGSTPTRGQTAGDFDRVHDQCWKLIRAGKYAEAERSAKRLYQWGRGPLADDPLALASASKTLGTVYHHQGRYGEAMTFYKQALEIKRRFLPENHSDVAASLMDLAILYDDQGRYGEAEPLYKQALEIYRQVDGENHPDVASSLNNLACLYADQGRYAEAEPLYKQALEIRRKILGENHPDVAQTLNNLAILYAEQGRYAEAEPLFKPALEIRRKALGENHPHVGQTLNNLANLYADQGRYAEAEPLLKQALEIKRKALGENHPAVADSLNNLAALYDEQGRYAEAEPLYKQALEIRRNALGENHPDVAQTLNNLALLYAEQGRYGEAEPLFKHTLEIRRNALGENHPDVAQTLNNLALLYAEQGRYGEAEPLFKQALEIWRKVLGENHRLVATSLNNLASLYQDQARYAEAEPLDKRALEIRRKALGENHPLVAMSLNNLAFLYANQGRYAEAEPLLDEAVRIYQRSSGDPQERARAYWNRARVAWKTGRHGQAVGDLQQALESIEWVRGRASGGELQRARFFAGWTHLYELMVGWQVELKDTAAVLSALERSRARALLDQMATAGLDLLAGLPEQEAERLRRRQSKAAGRVASLRKQLDVLRTRQDLTLQQKQQEQDRLLAELRQAQFEYTRAYADIRNASPAYRLAISDDQKPVRAEKLRQWIQQRQALLLEYLLGREGGYVFVLPSGGEPQVLKLELNAEQAAVLGVDPGPLTAERMRKILTREDETGVLDHLRASYDPKREQQAAKRLAVLWKVLIPQEQRKAILQGQYKRLAVLPDATLAPLPFETLVVQPGGVPTVENKEPKYLLDAGPPIVYAPSATILVNLAQREARVSQAADEPVLAVGDCVYGEAAQEPADSLLAQLAPRARYRSLGGQPQPLKYSGWELSFVAQVFQEKGIDVAWLKKDMATEQNVRHNIAGRRVVDLACHGRVDQSYGNLFGALALTPGPNSDDAANDGYLTLAETYELDLAGCELAILSACETNVGPEQRGEGVWALSRGFLVAGARRVAATNWLLDDEAAASTVSYFCSVLARQQAFGGPVDHAEALQKAKRWLRSVKTEKHDWTSPYYWAPMVLIGPQ